MNVFNPKNQTAIMNSAAAPQDMNMIWMTAPSPIEGFFTAQGVPLLPGSPSLDELTHQQSTLMQQQQQQQHQQQQSQQQHDQSNLPTEFNGHHLAGLQMNPVDLFTLQQQQLQLQQQLEMQNYAAMAAVAAAQQQQLQQHQLQQMQAQQQQQQEHDEEDESEQEENEDDEELQQDEEYGENSYQYGDDGSEEPEASSALNEDYSSNSNSSFLLSQQQQMFNFVSAAAQQQLQHHHHQHHHLGMSKGSKESFKKIKPVKRPGLVLKTPIAYQGDVDPSVIPIQREGMAVCEKCGAIGVKHSFYTRQRRFCSMACARGFELSSIQSALSQGSNNGNVGGGKTNNHQPIFMDDKKGGTTAGSAAVHLNNGNSNVQVQSSFRFKFANSDSNEATSMDGMENMDGDELSPQYATQVPILYRDVLPQEELPQIPKLDRLPSPCPQDEKILSVRRRPQEFAQSYDWIQMLEKVEFIAAPVTCFRHAPGFEMWPNIVIDMKVEVENTDIDANDPAATAISGAGLSNSGGGSGLPNCVWVASVKKVFGYKALLRYEGYGDESSHDFWVNLCSSEVHPVGWCATRGKPLIPPRSIENQYNDWKEFLVQHLTGARTLPSNFYNKISDSFRSRFRIGQQLEVVDKNRISQVKVATITKVIGKRMYLQYYDGPADDGFWCHEDSSLIHHVGWAASVGHNLAAPPSYIERVNDDIFQPLDSDATVELFKMNFSFEDYYLGGRVTGFVKGMKLEAIDPLNLSSICVATVMDVLNFGYIMIRIDSYDPDINGADWFCYHEKSPSIFPVGFCSRNNIKLTPPKGYDAETFTWQQYLANTNSVPASDDLFSKERPRHRFRIGMKLECADLMDPRLVCVATVARVVGRLLKIHFDGWEDDYDQWLDCQSPDIYPIGWCFLVGHKLEGPREIPPKVQQHTSKTSPKSSSKKKRGSHGSGKKKATKNDNANKAPPLTRTAQNKKDLEEFEIQKQQQLPMQVSAPVKTSSKREVVRNEEPTAVTPPKQTKQTPPSRSRKAQQPQLQPASSSISTTSVESTANDSRASTPSTPQKYIPKLGLSSSVNSSPESPSVGAGTNLQPDTWTIDEVVQFLTLNDCKSHSESFIASQVDGKRMLELTKDDIITLLGMKVGPALKIFDLIQQLKCRVNPRLKTSSLSRKFL